MGGGGGTGVGILGFWLSLLEFFSYSLGFSRV